MDLAGSFRKINIGDAEDVTVQLSVVARTLPDNEIQEQIKRVCFPGMHYPDLFSAIGKLVSGSGISHEALLDNSDFFLQYVSSSSETLKKKDISSIIKEHESAYANQVGSRIRAESLPVDCFSAEVYNNLPPEIAQIVSLIEEPRKRDVCLIGVLTALSAAFSRYRFYHGAGGDLKEYSPHLISLAVGAAGSGKGLTRYGYSLVQGIARKALLMRKDSEEAYKKRKYDYDRERKNREKEGRSLDDLTEPVKPPKYCFAMSASDTTQAALVEILYQNPIGGFAFDSEVDTLVQGNMKKDFGGFSDVIRKVFHHEPLARQRKGEGESYIVEQPRMAVMLSGTHDQLRRLIPSEYNGLFSRFWYYCIPKTFLEYSIAFHQQDLVGELCNSLQQKILETADLWSDELVYLKFSQEQEVELLNAMQDKRSVEDKFGGDIGASWLRMAITVKRIAVTLSALQGTNGEAIPDNCWKSALAILPALKTHCLQALDIVRTNQHKKEISKEQYDTLKGKGMSDVEIGKLMGVSAKTIQRRREEWTE
ncbi:MAG TPA: DUF3987 domain-containing protein [Flavisolibacter sp.]|nr:DUF3987 domain-containing protein [Flavisolibacter sp.]